MSDYLTADDLSEALGYSKNTIKTYVAKNKFPKPEIKFRKRVWKKDTIKKWLEARGEDAEEFEKRLQAKKKEEEQKAKTQYVGLVDIDYFDKFLEVIKNSKKQYASLSEVKEDLAQEISQQVKENFINEMVDAINQLQFFVSNKLSTRISMEIERTIKDLIKVEARKAIYELSHPMCEKIGYEIYQSILKELKEKDTDNA